MKTICLNMIVKNESKAMRRVIDSARKIIDYWVIVDTGSTDGTQSIIKECLKDIPGELHERPWVDFAYNRNEALDIARKKADYILILDADQVLVVLDSFDKTSLDQDFYLIKLTEASSDHYRPLLFSNNPLWFWEGVIHETLISSRKMQGEVLKSIYVDVSARDGYRSQDPKKYYKDAAVLEKAIEDYPENSRYYFYLAESYLRVKEYARALENFEKRATMEGEPAETFWTLFSIGMIQETLEVDPKTVISSYSKAYEFDNTRAEPLHRLSAYVLRMGCPSLGYIVAKFALNLKTPNVLNTDYYPWVYEWGLWAVIGDCCFEMKNMAEARKSYQNVLSCKSVPQNIRQGILAKLKMNPLRRR